MGNFLKFFVDEMITLKSLWWVPILVAIFLIKDLSTDVILQVIVKNILFKARSYGLQF